MVGARDKAAKYMPELSGLMSRRVQLRKSPAKKSQSIQRKERKGKEEAKDAKKSAKRTSKLSFASFLFPLRLCV